MIRSVIFDILFAIWTIFCAIFGLPLGLSKKYAIYLGKFWGNGVLILLKIVCNIGYSCKNLETLQNGSFLILSKHQSAWETIFFLTKIDKVSFVIKEGLLKVPFYGWYLKNMGMIPVKRSNTIGEMREMNNQILKSLQLGKSVVIFPQGTRTSPYEKMRYKFGCLEIFKNYSGKVALIALNSGLFWPKGFGIKNAGRVEVEITNIININQNTNIIQTKEDIESEIHAKSLSLWRNKP